MKHLINTLSLLLFSLTGIAQSYPVQNIPDSLRTGAVAVIRNSSEEFQQYDLNTGLFTTHIVITVFSEKDKSHAEFITYEDSFRELKNFSGEIFNEAGKSIKRISKKDLHKTNYSNDLATDSKITYYECHSPTYPFTVKYEYSIRYKNGILMYPTFKPASATGVSVEHASYRLQIPRNCWLKCKLQGGITPPQKSMQDKDSVFNFTVNGFKARMYEPYASYDNAFPYALLSPTKFCAHTICGSLSSWEKLGQWQLELLEGRDYLPPAVIANIKELTRNEADTAGKVKLVYEFLQNSTRYVSIQLGIGGWQPMPAAEVAKTGFGDCKALSNYMKALLTAINIPSYYVILSTKKQQLFRDYPNFSQANHVVLMVPLRHDSLWLECTSRTLPFGYIHHNIAGHDALAISHEHSFFCTLPTYPDTTNKTINKVIINLEPDGSAGLQIQSGYYMRDYEKMLYKIQGLNTSEETRLLANQLRTHKPTIKNIRKEIIKSRHPQINIDYTAHCEDYAQITRSRLIAALNPMMIKSEESFSASTRNADIKLNEGFFQSDTIILQTPRGYSIESLPNPVNIISDYGSFTSSIKQSGDKIFYTQTFTINKGHYPSTDYDNIRHFFKQINILNPKVILRK